VSKQVFWVVEGEIQHGALDTLKSLINEMVTNTKNNEPGTLAYEWFIDGGKTRCHIFERYQDSAAAMIHLRTFEERFASRLGQVMKIDRLALHGDAEKELVEGLRGDGTVFLLPAGGFNR
jgi:quinol monooxygenase YgiN